MNFNRIKSITQSKYFKPILKAIVLLWFFYAVYDIFLKDSSESTDYKNTYISETPNETNNDSTLNLNKPINNNNKNTNSNINSNKNDNYTLFNYTVTKGETIGSIATRFKTSKDKLKQINSLKNEQLKVGSIIKVPVKSIHLVKKGETLYSIAIKYGTTRKILKEANKLSSDADIKAGQNLCIPLL